MGGRVIHVRGGTRAVYAHSTFRGSRSGLGNVGTYQLGRRLIAASGVVEAHLGANDGEWVVLSRLASPWAHDATFTERFAVAARAVAEVQAPELIELIEYGNGPDGIWFAERGGDGEPLRALMTSNGGQLSTLESLAIVDRVAHGLSVLHDRGLVHGDPSPSSIFIRSSGEVGLLHTGFAPVAGHHEQRGPARSEPHAIAPEQLEGRYESATDVFRLGLMLLEMLTGRSLFVAADPKQVLENVRRFQGATASAFADVPPPLQPALEWMMEASPAKRATISEALSALQLGAGSLGELPPSWELARTFQRLMGDRQPPMAARTTELRLSPPRAAQPPPPVPRPSAPTGAVLGRVRPKTSELVAPPSPSEPPPLGTLDRPQCALVEALLPAFGEAGHEGVALLQLCADLVGELGGSPLDVGYARFVCATVVSHNLRRGAAAFATPARDALTSQEHAQLERHAAFLFDAPVPPANTWAKAVDGALTFARAGDSTCPAPWQPVVASLAGRVGPDVLAALERVLAR